MKLSMIDIVGALKDLDENELIRLNDAVVYEIKAVRNRTAASKRFLFSPGDRVTWTGRKGTYEGVVERVKLKKALVKVGVMTWDVPLGMLVAS
jgi:hypothetical protein